MYINYRILPCFFSTGSRASLYSEETLPFIFTQRISADYRHSLVQFFSTGAFSSSAYISLTNNKLSFRAIICPFPHSYMGAFNMIAGQKRKRRWGSKGFFGFRTAKFQALENLLHDAGDEYPTPTGALDGLIEGSHSDDGNFNLGTASKLRRTGSKMLSVVRLSGFGGMYIKFAKPEIDVN